jgi:hypothetical protein
LEGTGILDELGVRDFNMPGPPLGPPAMLVVEVFRELGRELTKEFFELTLEGVEVAGVLLD